MPKLKDRIVARMLSLPPDKDEFNSSILSSHRVYQGVCHNPADDRGRHQRVGADPALV